MRRLWPALGRSTTGEVHLQYETSLVYKYLIKTYRLFALYNATNTLIKPFAVEVKLVCLVNSGKRNLKQFSYTGCLGRNVPDFGRMFLKLKYTDLTKNTYIRSWKVTEIKAREKCGVLAFPRTVPGSRDVLPVHCACPSFSLHPAEAHSGCDCTCKVLGTLRTTATLVRMFM